MTVEYEVQFNSTTGVFTCFGLVDGHRYGARAKAVNVIIARAQVAFRLLKRLKETQPVVGLLLPPPDRKFQFIYEAIPYQNPLGFNPS